MTLVADQVSVRYGRKTVVDSVSLTLGPGLHALMGQNGAGKTTLLRTMATLQKPSSGTISLGEAVWPDGDVRLLRRRLGHLPQDTMRRSRLTVAEHLSYMCWLRKIPEDKAPAEVDRALDSINLTAERDTRIGALSGGMRRRVGVGSAIIGDPDLVILDEPSAGLDVSQRESLRDITAQIATRAVVVVSTHIVEDILTVADTVTVMKAGTVVTHCPRRDFARDGDLADFERRYLAMVGS